MGLVLLVGHDYFEDCERQESESESKIKGVQRARRV